MAEARTVLLTDTTYADLERERGTLASVGASLVVGEPPLLDESALLAHHQISSAHALMVELAPISAAVLEAAANCRVVARYGVGLDNIDLEAARERGIWVTNVPAYATDTVSDHAFAMILAAARELPRTSAHLAGGGWRETEALAQPLLLRGRRLGIVGFGSIGQALAARGAAFGMEVVAHDPWVADAAFERLGVTRLELAELLAASDVVSLHTALTEETRNLLDAQALAKMKPGAILVNTARGGLIDEAALLDALESGHLRAAGLDVFAREPLPSDDSLRTHPRVIATPHTAFWSDGSEVELRAAVVDAVCAVLRGEEPDGVVVHGGAGTPGG
jgi:D-3-phosphoglycerate dehydrogenase